MKNILNLCKRGLSNKFKFINKGMLDKINSKSILNTYKSYFSTFEINKNINESNNTNANVITNDFDFQREMILGYLNNNKDKVYDKQELKKMFDLYLDFSEIDKMLDNIKINKLKDDFAEIINEKTLDHSDTTVSKEQKIKDFFEEIKNKYLVVDKEKMKDLKSFKSAYYDLNTPSQFKGEPLMSVYLPIKKYYYIKNIKRILFMNFKSFFAKKKKTSKIANLMKKPLLYKHNYNSLKLVLFLLILYALYRKLRQNDSEKTISIDLNTELNNRKYNFSFNIDLNRFFGRDSSTPNNTSQNNYNTNNKNLSIQKSAFENFPQLFQKKDTFTPVLQTKIKTSLADVKGIDEVKCEIEQLIRIIKNPDKYKNAGAKLPKGILLVGKPGTGKTLLAKAIAGDSKVNFISTSGSDFEEMYVGVGSTRIKKLFNFAKENSPCIIFIDEIDALLTNTKRSDKEHSSSRSTINTFLTEMDGFNKIDGVFVIGATNHEKDLDSAAIRPGRFDKRIHVNLPSITGREEIADYYINKIRIPKTSDITTKIISQMTTGFTGAEIENLINISGIMAVNNNKGILDLQTLSEARDRILMGISNKYTLDIDKRRYMTAVHEMGHTLTCYKDKDCKESLLKVTIVPSGPALGVTQRMEVEDTLYNKDYFLYNIDMALGGHIAEKLLFGENNVTAGCSSDLSKATQIARKMVNEGFYAKDIGYLFVEQSQSVKEEKLGDKFKEVVNIKIDDILSSSHDRVSKLLENNSDELVKLSRALFRYNTLDVNEITLILENRENEITRPIVRQDYEEKNAEEYS